VVDVGAGEGARRQAEAAARAAEVLERKAAYARTRAEAFAKGAAGERALAERIAGLTVTGWAVVHDRMLPAGGNLDHLVIGPTGIFVLDAKNWSGVVTVDRGLRSGNRDVSKAIDQMSSAVAEVSAALAGMTPASARGALVLTHEVNAQRTAECVGDTVVVGMTTYWMSSLPNRGASPQRRRTERCPNSFGPSRPREAQATPPPMTPAIKRILSSGAPTGTCTSHPGLAQGGIGSTSPTRKARRSATRTRLPA
jgi:hypothetical protein